MVHSFLDEETQWFASSFDVLVSLANTYGQQFALSANSPVSQAQAMAMAGTAARFADIDYNGLVTQEKAGEETLVVSDYAGILPDVQGDIVFWHSGAGYLEAATDAPVVLVDLLTLNPAAKAPGALVFCRDAKLRAELERFASLGVEKGHLWNDRVRGRGIDGLMSPLAREYWEASLSGFIEATKRTAQTAAFYAERLGRLKLVDTLPTHYPRFYPFRLAPELFCPKEDIFAALQQEGIAASVPFKPLYRYDAFKAEPLEGAEQFYKAVMALPVHGIGTDEAQRVAEVLERVIERYGYRGCTF